MATSGSKAIVTGVAGFIGSHLAEQLLTLGYDVTGIDCFTDYYPRFTKEGNLLGLRYRPGFSFIESDILDLNWQDVLDGAEYVFHQAGQAGVRGSWGDNFSIYVRNNILATQRLLEAAKLASSLKSLIVASSSSVYGDAEVFPTTEDVTPRPVSPYGVTKLAAEHLCRMYHASFGVPIVALRYFTAYGPRQRPDMAFHRFIEAMLAGTEIVVYGNGEQTRDFTYVSDTVAANILATKPAAVGHVFNVGGGGRITVNQVIRILEDIIGRPARVRYVPRQDGDARNTCADITRAGTVLGYQPRVGIEQGLRQQVASLTQRVAPMMQARQELGATSLV